MKVFRCDGSFSFYGLKADEETEHPCALSPQSDQRFQYFSRKAIRRGFQNAVAQILDWLAQLNRTALDR